MDSSTWIHGYADSRATSNSGFMCGYASSSSYAPAELQCREESEEQLLVSSQIQYHLNQISMHMNMDDEPVYAPSDSSNGAAVSMPVVDDFLASHHGGGFNSSSSSSSFRSTSLSCSLESSPHILAAPAAGDGYLQYPEVSSQVPLLPSAVPYDDQHYLSFEDTAVTEHEVSTSAFKNYSQHLGPRRKSKPGASGQRMFKTAMSVLTKMHMASRYKQHCYYQQASTEAAEQPPPSVNQLQHVISERKRREKLNDSFQALRTVLPPGSKKDKTSILIRAREYVNSLKSKVCELEEKNKDLESRLSRCARAGYGEDGVAGNVEIEITREAAGEEETRDLCTLKIVVKSACGNMTDVVLRTMQCLKDQMGDDVSLMAMSTGGGGDDHQGSLTLQLKTTSGAKWDETAVKQAVAKVIADTLPSQPQSAETTARRDDAGIRPHQQGFRRQARPCGSAGRARHDDN